jgi:selenide,water dikinase
VASEAGIAIVGGHTIKSEEPIFGLAVVGTVHPARVLSNAGAKPGDALILTKPLGLGIISTAAKNDQDFAGAITEAIRVMTTLNRAAAEVLSRFEVHALTDVTGFGLLGHLRNVTAASGVEAEVRASAVPVLDAAREYVAAGIAPGGTRANAKFLADWVEFAPGVSAEEQLLLCDAQTSGGLLAAVPEAVADEVAKALGEAGTLASAVVGRITGKGRADSRGVGRRAPGTRRPAAFVHRGEASHFPRKRRHQQTSGRDGRGPREGQFTRPSTPTSEAPASGRGRSGRTGGG